jgi:DNA-binding transcriptional regulator LsrR (DeoR family)
MSQNVLIKMYKAGWVGDVQFRPYSAEGPLPENVCPVRAVTLFELDELVRIAKDRTNGKYVVLVAGPCGECGETKKNALRPLLANEQLRLWTHLIVDAKTAKELLS